MHGLLELEDFIGSFWLKSFLSSYGYFAVLLLTFLEGETIIVLAGIAAAQGLMNPLLVGLSGFIGSFLGDQLYYTIGRYYGLALLERWPSLKPQVEWAFRLVRKYQDLYILSFRFIYGIRNVSPFVIAISGVTRRRFVTLNGIAALLWAATFTSSGYFFGYILEPLVAGYRDILLISFFVLLILTTSTMLLMKMYRRRKKQRSAQVDFLLRLL